MKELTPAQPKTFAAAHAATGPARFRVLVADDVESNRLLTIWLLGRVWPDEREVLVECAADGTEALEKIRCQQYALVVLDWNMPRQDGATVLRTIRENGLRVPVVVMSGQRRETIANDLETMAAAFVNKDELSPDNFSSAIAAASRLLEGPDPAPLRS